MFFDKNQNISRPMTWLQMDRFLDECEQEIWGSTNPFECQANQPVTRINRIQILKAYIREEIAV
jgi:hypothetical protein